MGRMTRMAGLVLAWWLAGMLLMSGCARMLPNPDPAISNTPTSKFKTDANGRFPYKVDAPRGNPGEAPARAQAAYDVNWLEIVNLSDEDWSEIEVWVNRKYVCFLPVMESKKLKRIEFSILFDENGGGFPRRGKAKLVEKVEIYRDGVMYEVPCTVAD